MLSVRAKLAKLSVSVVGLVVLFALPALAMADSAALPPKGNYTFTVNKTSTVELGYCTTPSPWVDKDNPAMVSTFDGSIDKSGAIIINGESTKKQWPKIKLRGCQPNVSSWFSDKATGTNDNKYIPAKNWNGQLNRSGSASLEARVDAALEATINGTVGNCWIGEVNLKRGGYSNILDVDLNQGTWAYSGSGLTIRLANTTLPTDPSFLIMEAVAPHKYPQICGLVGEVLFWTYKKGKPPIAYNLTITAKRS